MKYSVSYERISKRTFTLTAADVRAAILEYVQKESRTQLTQCPAGHAQSWDVNFDSDGIDLEGEPLAIVTQAFKKVEAGSALEAVADGQ